MCHRRVTFVPLSSLLEAVSRIVSPEGPALPETSEESRDTIPDNHFDYAVPKRSDILHS
ncbi:hypothetical protein TGAMA5MH_04175 [Trichoderma gamsii]|uniref:Uncharacterized protein n=1 Tax=Trichoderma gamsii TaxID=398673 RepID=A0A2K0TEE0_9HYPO|nr:hypothetical protein TGAMA5MH_04175 [Trichoderma gamsii]